MDDIRVVMDAAGMEQAVLFAAHEGSRIAVLFAATYPERTRALVLHDPSARGRRGPATRGPAPDEAWRSWLRDVADGWGTSDFFERYLRDYSPSVADDDGFRRWFVRHMRSSASPGAAVAFQRMVMEGDVSDVLPAVRVPTLVLSRPQSVGATRYVAERIPAAEWREIPGLVDGYSWVDPDANAVLLAETETFLRGLASPSEPERLLATFLFTDIVGSTEHAARIGDTAWRRLLAQHDGRIRARLAEHRGNELSTTGDGFFASFDGPGRAIRCARAIRDDVQTLGIEIRAGLHTGEAELRNGTVGGIAVHIAARVAALAGASEILVSRTVRDLVAGSLIEFDDRGEHDLKGVPGRWPLYAVRG